jgi:hypothetical protein
LRPDQANSSLDSIFRAERTRGMAQVVEHLLCKCERLCSSPSLTKKEGEGGDFGKKIEINTESTLRRETSFCTFLSAVSKIRVKF